MSRPCGAIELMHETLIGEAAATGSAAVVLSDDDLRYVAANDAACDLLGYSRLELLALDVSDVVLGEADGLRHASRAVIDGATHHGTACVRRKDGSEIEVAYVSFRGSISALQQVVTVTWPLEPNPNGSGGGFRGSAKERGA
jgi:PAS domain S-box-containing protein